MQDLHKLNWKSRIPGMMALFFQGAGADQNPLPRRTIPLAKQYGSELAAAVERVLEEDMKLLSPQLSTAYSEIALPYTDLPSKEELQKIAVETSSYPDWHRKWASTMLEKIDRKEKIPASISILSFTGLEGRGSGCYDFGR